MSACLRGKSQGTFLNDYSFCTIAMEQLKTFFKKLLYNTTNIVGVLLFNITVEVRN